MDLCFSPHGTITAKDELIWLHAARPALLPHVFDVIESLVFAKAIVPPPLAPGRESKAALLPREINLPLRGSDSIDEQRGQRKIKVIERSVRLSIGDESHSYFPRARLKINSPSINFLSTFTAAILNTATIIRLV